jgi:hypothetical protein
MMRLYRIPRLDRKVSANDNAMTIAIGFNCMDGVVFCSDRQATDRLGLKYEMDKILTRENNEKPASLMFTFAGVVDSAETMCDRVWDRIDGLGSSKTKNRLRSIFKCKYSKGLESLLAISIKGQPPIMFRTKGEQVYDARWEFIGAGDSSVVRYLWKVFLRDQKQIPTPTAQLIGYLLVSAANESVEGCSGGPDMAVLNRWGHIQRRTGMQRYSDAVGRLIKKFGSSLDSFSVLEMEGIPIEALSSPQGQKEAERIFARNEGKLLKLAQELKPAE